MFNKPRRFLLIILIFALTIIFNNCGKKDADTKDDKKNISEENSQLIKTDEKGNARVDLKLKPKIGDIFRYKMVKSSMESSADASKPEDKISQEQTEVYYYTQEVTEVSESGVITLKMKYDSVNVTVKESDKKDSRTVAYNSNVKDSVSSMKDFLVYNNMIGSSFKIRVGANNDFIEPYELEGIYDKLFKELGDTISQQTKDAIKESLKSSLKDVLSGQYQEFPKNEVPKDSSWSVTKTSDNPPFRYKNIVSYKVSDIQKNDNQSIVTIDGKLDIEFIDKDYKTKEGSMRIEDVNAGGTGIMRFNLSRGCMTKKETNQSVKMIAKISSRGQSMKTVKETSLKLNIELL
jgi:hypothetical protein